MCSTLTVSSSRSSASGGSRDAAHCRAIPIELFPSAILEMKDWIDKNDYVHFPIEVAPCVCILSPNSPQALSPRACPLASSSPKSPSPPSCLPKPPSRSLASPNPQPPNPPPSAVGADSKVRFVQRDNILASPAFGHDVCFIGVIMYKPVCSSLYLCVVERVWN